MYRILIVGMGYVGPATAGYFVAKKQKVYGLVRRPERIPELEEAGVIPVLGDLANPESLQKIPAVDFIVVCPAPDGREDAAARALYVDGIGHFLKAIPQKGRPSLVLYLSSTGVWGDPLEGWVEESVLPKPETERQKILMEAEQQILNSGYPAVIFRLAGIYGPGRNRIASLQKGEWPAEERDVYLNLIHRDDIAPAIETLFKKAEEGQVYIGADDEPVLKSEYYGWLAGRLKIEPKFHGIADPARKGKRCRNAKLKSLGFAFKFPNFRAGYESFL